LLIHVTGFLKKMSQPLLTFNVQSPTTHIFNRKTEKKSS
jgi:hypothetical protein